MNRDRFKRGGQVQERRPQITLASVETAMSMGVRPAVWLWDVFLDFLFELWNSIFRRKQAQELIISRHLRRALKKYLGKPIGDAQNSIRLQTYIIMKKMLWSESDAKYISFDIEQLSGKMKIVPLNLFTYLLMFGIVVPYSEVADKTSYTTAMGTFGIGSFTPVHPLKCVVINSIIGEKK